MAICANGCLPESRGVVLAACLSLHIPDTDAFVSELVLPACLQERVHRPLTVFAGTWNVGNAPPSMDLRSWLQGVEDMEHDLVAIGVQVGVMGGSCTCHQGAHDRESSCLLSSNISLG